MSNDFINRRFYDDRRDRTPTPRTLQGEVIEVANFDTFIWHIPGNIGSDRWNFLPNTTAQNPPQSSKEIPIGLLNPWNHSDAANFATEFQLIAPRTPTRAVLGFDLQGLTTGASIIDATLSLTIAGVCGWNNFVPVGGVVPGNAPGDGTDLSLISGVVKEVKGAN